MADKVLVEFVVEADGAIRAVRQFKGETEKVAEGTQKAGRGVKWLEGNWAGLLGGFAAAGGAFAIVQGGLQGLQRGMIAAARAAVQFSIDSIQFGDSVEKMQLRLNALMGGEVLGEQAFEQIRRFATEVALTLTETVNLFAQLRGAGIEPTEQRMQALVDAAVKYTGEARNVENITVALAQAFGKGKLQAEEMQQLVERGLAPAWQILADSLGVSETAVREMSAAGEIGKEQILDFIDALGTDAFGAAGAEMDLLSGQISNLGVAWDDVKLQFAEGGALEGAKLLVAELAELVAELIESGAVERFGTAFGQFLQDLASVAQIMGAHREEIIAVLDALLMVAQANWTLAILGMTAMAELFRLRTGINLFPAETTEAAEKQATEVENLAKVWAAFNEEMRITGGLDPELRAAVNAQTQGIRTRLELELRGAKDRKQHHKEWKADLDEQAKELKAQNQLLRELGEAAEDGFTWAQQNMAEFDRGAQDARATIEGLGDEIEALPAPALREHEWRQFVMQTAPIIGQVQYFLQDALTAGLTGNFDVIEDLWVDMWHRLTSIMIDMIGNAFSSAINAFMTAEPGQGFAAFREALGGGNLLTTLGLAAGTGALAYGAREGNTTASVLGGALSGALAGLSLSIPGGPPGWVVGLIGGALVGALGSLFGGGGEERPGTSAIIGAPGAFITTTGQETTAEQRAIFGAQRLAEFQNAFQAYRAVLQIFMDPELWDFVRELPTFRTEGFEDMTLEQLAQVFSQQWLPEAMENTFRRAINIGLRDLGATEETLRRLWDEVGQLGGQERLDALAGYIGAVVQTGELIDSLDWNAILDETRMGGLERFFMSINDLLEQVEVGMMGLDDLTLAQRAEQAAAINDLILNARAAEIAMLQEIDRLQQSINTSIDRQIEDLLTGGMSEDQLQAYYREQIDSILEALRGGVSDPQELAQLMQDLQRYVGLYGQALGPALDETLFSGLTMRDELIAILEEGRALANAQLEEYRDQIRDQNERLIEALEALRQALLDAGGMPGDEPPELPPELPGGEPEIPVIINVYNNTGIPIETLIDARIGEWFNSTGGGAIN